MEQRAELEERIQQEYFNYHFEQPAPTTKEELRTAAESQIEKLQRQTEEEQALRQELHPWHGKTNK